MAGSLPSSPERERDWQVPTPDAALPVVMLARSWVPSSTGETSTNMTEGDGALLDDLNHLGDTLGPFSDGILTDSLSVAGQLDFSDQLIAAAGRIRARVEKASTAHRLRTTHGDAR